MKMQAIVRTTQSQVVIIKKTHRMETKTEIRRMIIPKIKIVKIMIKKIKSGRLKLHQTDQTCCGRRLNFQT